MPALGALTSLTGGGGLTGGSAGPATSGVTGSSTTGTTAGNINVGGINLNSGGFRFDPSDPLHLASAVGVAVAAYFLLRRKK